MKRFFDYRGSLILFAFAALLQMQACGVFEEYENVDTTRKAILVANAEIRGANLLLQDLIRRDVIPDNEARQALGALRSGHESLQTALTLIDVSGDPIGAESRLEAANTALTIALTLLSAFATEPIP